MDCFITFEYLCKIQAQFSYLKILFIFKSYLIFCRIDFYYKIILYTYLSTYLHI